MATLGDASKNSTADSTTGTIGYGYMVGNITQHTAANATLDGTLNCSIKGSLGSGQGDQKFRGVIYNCSNSTTPSSLLSASAEATVTAGTDVTTSFTGLSGALVQNNYYWIGIWAGTLVSGTRFAAPWIDAPGGLLGFYTQVPTSAPWGAFSYDSTAAPPDPWPTANWGTENKVYGILDVDYTLSTSKSLVVPARRIHFT